MLPYQSGLQVIVAIHNTGGMATSWSCSRVTPAGTLLLRQQFFETKSLPIECPPETGFREKGRRSVLHAGPPSPRVLRTTGGAREGEHFGHTGRNELWRNGLQGRLREDHNDREHVQHRPCSHRVSHSPRQPNVQRNNCPKCRQKWPDSGSHHPASLLDSPYFFLNCLPYFVKTECLPWLPGRAGQWAPSGAHGSPCAQLSAVLGVVTIDGGARRAVPVTGDTGKAVIRGRVTDLSYWVILSAARLPWLPRSKERPKVKMKKCHNDSREITRRDLMSYQHNRVPTSTSNLHSNYSGFRSYLQEIDSPVKTDREKSISHLSSIPPSGCVPCIPGACRHSFCAGLPAPLESTITGGGGRQPGQNDNDGERTPVRGHEADLARRVNLPSRCRASDKRHVRRVGKRFSASARKSTCCQGMMLLPVYGNGIIPMGSHNPGKPQQWCNLKRLTRHSVLAFLPTCAWPSVCAGAAGCSYQLSRDLVGQTRDGATAHWYLPRGERLGTDTIQITTVQVHQKKMIGRRGPPRERKFSRSPLAWDMWIKHEQDFSGQCIQTRSATVQNHLIQLHPRISEHWTDFAAPRGPHDQRRGLLLALITPSSAPEPQTVQAVVQSPCAPTMQTRIAKCQLESDVYHGHRIHASAFIIRGDCAGAPVNSTRRPWPADVSQGAWAHLSIRPRNLFTGGAVVTQLVGRREQQMDDCDMYCSGEQHVTTRLVQSRAIIPRKQVIPWQQCSEQRLSSSCLSLTSPLGASHKSGDGYHFPSTCDIYQIGDLNFSRNKVPNPGCLFAPRGAPACQPSPAGACRLGPGQTWAPPDLPTSAAECAREWGKKRLATQAGTHTHIIRLESRGLGPMRYSEEKCQSEGNREVGVLRISCKRSSSPADSTRPWPVPPTHQPPWLKRGLYVAQTRPWGLAPSHLHRPLSVDLALFRLAGLKTDGAAVGPIMLALLVNSQSSGSNRHARQCREKGPDKNQGDKSSKAGDSAGDQGASEEEDLQRALTLDREPTLAQCFCLVQVSWVDIIVWIILKDPNVRLPIVITLYSTRRHSVTREATRHHAITPPAWVVTGARASVCTPWRPRMKGDRRVSRSYLDASTGRPALRLACRETRPSRVSTPATNKCYFSCLSALGEAKRGIERVLKFAMIRPLAKSWTRLCQDQPSTSNIYFRVLLRVPGWFQHRYEKIFGEVNTSIATPGLTGATGGGDELVFRDGAAVAEDRSIAKQHQEEPKNRSALPMTLARTTVREITGSGTVSRYDCYCIPHRANERANKVRIRAPRCRWTSHPHLQVMRVVAGSATGILSGRALDCYHVALMCHKKRAGSLIRQAAPRYTGRQLPARLPTSQNPKALDGDTGRPARRQLNMLNTPHYRCISTAGRTCKNIREIVRSGISNTCIKRSQDNDRAAGSSYGYERSCDICITPARRGDSFLHVHAYCDKIVDVDLLDLVELLLSLTAPK